MYRQTLGADGEMWNTWGKYVFDSGFNFLDHAFCSYVTARYGQPTLQYIQQNPSSDYATQIVQSYLSSKQDNTLLYVAFGFGALLLIMMMNNNNSRRR